MRKEYIAPDLYYESFVLSESIAAGCSSSGILTYLQGLGFFASTSECQAAYEDGSYEGYCYWSGSTLLNS